ncbi:MAG: hypothetical protein RIQ62_1905 [Bacteroidota bacterium]
MCTSRLFSCMNKLFLIILFSITSIHLGRCQSVAHIWNEAQLSAIRIDAARPPVQARNLFHVSLAMYDAWAAYDSVASPYLLGHIIHNTYYPFTGITPPSNIDSARNKAISFAAYRVLKNRYALSPNGYTTFAKLDSTLLSLGYNSNDTSTNYSSGNAAALGNYIAQQVIQMGMNDGSNQINNYAGTGYSPNNAPLLFYYDGNASMTNVNSWQPLSFVTCIDQNGIPCGTSTPSFIGPRWGKVYPFSMPVSSAIPYQRSGQDYPVYYDPGQPPMLNTTTTTDSMSTYFKWGHSMVVAWSAHLDPNDTTHWDISPHAMGNTSNYPSSLAAQQSFYHFLQGGQNSNGYAVNPVTGLPYTPQIVKRGDYTRVVSQFWADGPNSETPPGHWYVLLNSVSSYPGFQKRFQGQGPVLSNLEWDIKSYFVLGSAMHDAAIACWGIKGWYDAPRPISTIRKMADLGQSSNPALPHYHPGGLALIPGSIELVTLSDPPSLRGYANENLNKIKVKSWKGFDYIGYNGNTPMNAAGVGWILAEKWMPYQRYTFVTPPFAGYVSGHSTYSRAGAVSLESITGSPYFPGGLGEYVVPANSNYLGFETGPTTIVRLQWASYKDASDQASLSRIWGGIHPPFDDMPGRMIGEQIGAACFQKAKALFTDSLLEVQISCNLNNPICSGSALTFTATTINAPQNAIYHWKKNGVLVSSDTSNVYTTTNYANGDIIACELSANGYVAGSNTLTLQVSSCVSTTLNIKVYLQGYYVGSGFMSPVLYNQGVTADTMICDSVTVELHEAFYPYSLVATTRGALQRDGSLSVAFMANPDYYYLVLKHRNTIQTWTSEPIWFGNSSVLDLTTDPSLIFAYNEVPLDSMYYGLYSGEINADDNIDLIDLMTVENDISMFAYGYLPTDINGDGNVDLLDSPLIESNVSNFIYAVYPN